MDVKCAQGFVAKYDMSDHGSADPDEQLSDLHYRDICDFAVGLNTSADWHAREEYAVMPAFGEKLSDSEIAAIATHERSSWGNKAAPVTADFVKKIRETIKTETTATAAR